MKGTVIGKYICFHVKLDYDLDQLQTVMCLLYKWSTIVTFAFLCTQLS